MIFSLTTLMTSSKNFMWNFAWYKTMHQSLEFEQWFFFLWEKSYSIFLSISFLFLPFYILWFLFYASQPSSVGKPLPVRPSAARDPASPLDRGLLGVDRTARGESRLRRKSCLTAAISRSAGSTDGSDEADVRKLRQKLAWRPTASSGESRRPERQISSLTASAQRPQIQRPPCRSRTLAMYAGVHSSVRPQHSQAANSTSAVTAATESATLITVADMTKNESGDLKAREKKPWTAWNKKERCIARSISLSIYRFGGSDGDEMGVDGQTATSPTQQQRQRLGIPSLLRHLPLLPAVSPCLLWVKRPSSLNQDRDQNLALLSSSFVELFFPGSKEAVSTWSSRLLPYLALFFSVPMFLLSFPSSPLLPLRPPLVRVVLVFIGGGMVDPAPIIGEEGRTRWVVVPGIIGGSCHRWQLLNDA